MIKIIKDNGLNTKDAPIFVQSFDPASLKYMRSHGLETRRSSSSTATTSTSRPARSCSTTSPIPVRSTGRWPAMRACTMRC